MSFALITATGEIRHGKLVLAHRNVLNESLKTIKHGTQVELAISRLYATRSLPQNRYYWGVVIQALCDHTGYRPDEMHELMKMKFLPKTYGMTDSKGDVVAEFVMGGSTRKLKMDEFSDYVSHVKQFAMDDLGLYIPEAGEVL